MRTEIAVGAVAVVALFHFGFMALEMTQWAKPRGRKVTHLSEGAARETVGVGVNMGLYNGFLGFALLWATFALGRRDAYSVQWLLLGFIAVAGLVGAFSIKSPSIALTQSVPALIALVLIWADRPYPRTEAEAVREIVKIERQLLALKDVDARAEPSKDVGKAGECPERAGEGGVPRGQHPKMHGLVRAKFTVADDVPDALRAGVFKGPGAYDAWVRFSNARNRDDREPGGHGMAIKLLGVPGTKAGDGAATQDFVLFDNPVFFVGDPFEYVEFEEAVLRGYGKPKPLERATVLLNYYWRRPLQLANLRQAQSHKVVDPAAVRYWSVTPYRLGAAAVKYSVRPVENGPPVAVPDSCDMTREALKARLKEGDVVFEFQVQPQTDPAAMPVEDPTKLWSEAASVPKTVARLTVPKQEFDTEERRALAEALSFTPWHALPGHEPLGGINRVRKAVYESLSEFRHALNHTPKQEPAGAPTTE